MNALGGGGVRQYVTVLLASNGELERISKEMVVA
jgi:hypothetical protein